MAARTLQVSVVTPEGAVLEEEATSAVFPAYDGEYGVLPGHAPLLSLVGIGALEVKTAGGTKKTLYVDGGFAQVVDDRLTVLTEQALPIEELSVEHADELLEQARAMTVTDEASRAAREALYQRAWVEKRLARKQP